MTSYIPESVVDKICFWSTNGPKLPNDAFF